MQESRHDWHWWLSQSSMSGCSLDKGRGGKYYRSPDTPRNHRGRDRGEVAARRKCDSKTQLTSLCFMEDSHLWLCWLIRRDSNQQGSKHECWTRRTIVRCPAEVGAPPTNLSENLEHILSKDASSLISWCWQVVKLNVSQTTSCVGEWFSNP